MPLYYRLHMALTRQEQERIIPLLRQHRRAISAQFYALVAKNHDPARLPAVSEPLPRETVRINLTAGPACEGLKQFLSIHGRKQRVRAMIRTCLLASVEHCSHKSFPAFVSPLKGKPLPPENFFDEERLLLSQLGTDFGAATTSEGSTDVNNMQYDWFAVPLHRYHLICEKAGWKAFLDFAAQVCPEWCNG